jgi:hypothetical protein
MRRSYNPIATRIFGVEATSPGDLSEDTIRVPLGTTRILMRGTGDAYRAFLQPGILGIAVYRSDVSNNVNPWVTRGTNMHITVDLTSDRGFPNASGQALYGLPKGSFLYVGFASPFVTQLHFDVNAANSGLYTVTAEFWAGDRWLSLSNVLDGTLNNGASLGKDGAITWDLESQWKASTVNPELPVGGQLPGPLPVCYWLRLSWTGSLSHNTSLTAVWPAQAGGTAYGGYFAADTEYEIDVARCMVRGLSFVTTGENAVTLHATFLLDESTFAGTGDIRPPGLPPRPRPFLAWWGGPPGGGGTPLPVTPEIQQPRPTWAEIAALKQFCEDLISGKYASPIPDWMRPGPPEPPPRAAGPDGWNAYLQKYAGSGNGPWLNDDD